ncbi:MAG: hypothetical protein RMI01_09575 [Thermodesulfovibrio sp.]|nr:hypothetical protein [Thermodesulfovibrio sp.]
MYKEDKNIKTTDTDNHDYLDFLFYLRRELYSIQSITNAMLNLLTSSGMIDLDLKYFKSNLNLLIKKTEMQIKLVSEHKKTKHKRGGIKRWI